VVCPPLIYTRKPRKRKEVNLGMQTRKQKIGKQETEKRKQVTKYGKTSQLRTDKKETGESRTKKLMREKHGNKERENKTEYWKTRKARTRKQGIWGKQRNWGQVDRKAEDRKASKLDIKTRKFGTKNKGTWDRKTM
jgi:hypothetical protein